MKRLGGAFQIPGIIGAEEWENNGYDSLTFGLKVMVLMGHL